MTPERLQRIEQIYHAARERPPAQRADFLREACEMDISLQTEVESLLAQAERAEHFIESPALELTATSLVTEKPPSMAGEQLGAYEILAPLGSGGMGEVYLARDTRLDRMAAVKVLPAGLSRDRNRMRRFKVEAKAASALNHPNVATIYEIGESNHGPFIAMEYVEGQTLATKINGTPLTTDLIVEIGVQVTDALAEAELKGIVHRDIKPANIMLTSRGQVKVLDFGVAKLSPGIIRTDSAKSTVTGPGLLMGTVDYMSPEQALGRSVDPRSDLFSLGIVLYEMATRQKPFSAPTPTETIDRIINAEPASISGLNQSIPPELERIIHKCLEKQPARRYQSARDVQIDLRNLQGGSSSLKVMPAVRRRRVAWQVLLSSLVLVTGAFWIFLRQPLSLLPPVRVVPLTSLAGQKDHPAVSPDGSQVAFLWDGGRGGELDLYVKLLGAGTPLRLGGGAIGKPAWSPDGRQIAFPRRLTRSVGIFLIPVLGGTERKLAEVSTRISPFGVSLDWSPDGKYLAVPDGATGQESQAIYLISVDSGHKRRLTPLAPQFLYDEMPTISPDGRVVAFVRGASFQVNDIYVAPAAGGEPRRLSFDKVWIIGLTWTADGRSIVFSSNRSGLRSLWRISATGGQPEPLSGAGTDTQSPSISPHANRLIYLRSVFDINIWRTPGPTATARNTTPEPLINSTRVDAFPQFSPDSKRIAFTSDRSGSWEVWVSDNEGKNPLQLTALGGPAIHEVAWFPDGQRLAFDCRLEGHSDIFLVGAQGGKPHRLTTEPADDLRPSISRDGRWVYFVSNRSGRMQVWKTPAEGGQALQVTKGGGGEAFESFDAKWLYYFRYHSSREGIWRLPVVGGEEEPVFDHPAGWGYWALLENGICFVNRKATPRPAIEFFNFANRRTQPADHD